MKDTDWVPQLDQPSARLVPCPVCTADVGEPCHNESFVTFISVHHRKRQELAARGGNHDSSTA